MDTFDNYVDGQWTASESGKTFIVRNPADTTDVVGEYQLSTVADTEAAIAAATDAQQQWLETPGPERGRIVHNAGAALEARKDGATETLVREEGKTWSEASGEVQRAIDVLYYYAEKARDLGGTSKTSSIENRNLRTKREPLGTVGLITPWNYPLAIPSWKLAPALVTGNTAVIKPATAAPGMVRILFECLEGTGIPNGVANYVTGPGGEVGSVLTTHPDIDAVSFTGSTAVGTAVATSAAENMKRVQCEMGGKNPTVVMPSADMESAVDVVGVGAFGTTGQSCTACSRAIVHEEIYNEFVDVIVEYVESLNVDPGLDDPDMGPQVSQSELDSSLEYIDIAHEDGATLKTGGQESDGNAYEDGFFIEPTVFADVTSDMRIAQEEVFGPVLAVMNASDFKEAMSIANDIEYGLSSSIVTQDLSEANWFVDKIEAGVAKVNEKTTGLELHAPFGGYKKSSTNTYREQGDAGIDFFTATKTVYTNY